MAESPWSAPDEVSPVVDEDFDELDFIDAPGLQRWLAYMVDSIAQIVAILVCFVAVFVPMVFLFPEMTDQLVADDNPLLDILSRIAGFAIAVVYGAAFEGSSWNATPGKLLFGLEVRDHSGRALDFNEALQRNAVKMLMLSCCGLLALTAIGNQGLWNEQTNRRTVKRVG